MTNNRDDGDDEEMLRNAKRDNEILDIPTGPIVSVCIAAAASICEDNDNKCSRSFEVVQIATRWSCC